MLAVPAPSHDHARLPTIAERLTLSLAFVLAIGCDAGSGDEDGGLAVDSGPRMLMDAGPPEDGSVGRDSGPHGDGGALDAGSFDAGSFDAGPILGSGDCMDANVHCVDDTAGATQEFDTIQAAVDVAMAGHTVLVFDGSYVGFRVEESGTASARITIRSASGMVPLTGPPSGANNVIRIQNASYVTIAGFSIIRSGAATPYDYNYAGMAARGARVDDPMRGLIVRDMEITGCSPGGFYCSQCQGLLLERNFIHDNVRDERGSNGMGVYLSNAATDDVIVRGNRFWDNEGPGIHLNGDSSIGGDGLQTGHLFEGNSFIGNGQNGLNMDGVQSATFINNVIATGARHGIRGFRIDGSAGPSGFVIINNTFVGNADTPLKFTADGGGHVLFNNLLVANGSNDFDIAESTPQLEANLLLGSGDGVFVGVAERNYDLVSGAPPVDAGSASFAGQSAPVVDLEGRARDARPDVGAMELQP